MERKWNGNGIQMECKWNEKRRKHIKAFYAQEVLNALTNAPTIAIIELEKEIEKTPTKAANRRQRQ